MLVTVIVPTHQRFGIFIRCIESLLAQDFDHSEYEIIAVHDGLNHSYDLDVIDGWKKQFPNFHFFAIEKSGASEARNYAISLAQGLNVLMTDDDCVTRTDWISTLVTFIETHPEMVAVGGQVLSVEPRTFIQEYIRFKNLLRRPVKNTKGEIVTAITANVVYRKFVLEAVSGFSSRFRECGIPYGGEDLDLAFRASKYGKLGYCEEAIVYHHHRSSINALIRQHFVYGRGVYIACVNNGIRYEELRFSRPSFHNLIKHAFNSFIRLFTISIPEFQIKCLPWWKYPSYFWLDLLRRNVFMFGAVYEFHRRGGD